jgi:hypothetical protein
MSGARTSAMQLLRGSKGGSSYRVIPSFEFASTDEAKSFWERLLASGALDNVNVLTAPTVVEVADEATY